MFDETSNELRPAAPLRPAATHEATRADAFVPFAESPLWDRQRRYFCRRGVQAWRAGEVPFYVTSHAAMAHAYAVAVERYLRDLALCGALDPDAPVYLLELGCGHGAFAQLFLHALDTLGVRAGLPPLCYVMSDIAATNLDSAAALPQLRRWRAAGQLDYALVDAEQPGPVKLRLSGETLREGALVNPLIVVANYVFDGIRCDLFFVGDGAVARGEVALEPSVSPGASPGASQGASPGAAHGALDGVELVYRAVPLDGAAYESAGAQALMAAYAGQPGRRALMFPRHAIACCRWLMGLAADGLLLSADRGHHLRGEVLHRRAPRPARHGSFSLPVNYHALGASLEASGAQVLQTVQRRRGLNVMLACWGDARPQPGLRSAFEHAFAGFGPEDAFVLKKALEDIAPRLSPEQLLAVWRACRLDARVLSLCAPVLMRALPGASKQTRRGWKAALMQATQRGTADIAEADLLRALTNLL